VTTEAGRRFHGDDGVTVAGKKLASYGFTLVRRSGIRIPWVDPVRYVFTYIPGGPN